MVAVDAEAVVVDRGGRAVGDFFFIVGDCAGVRLSEMTEHQVRCYFPAKWSKKHQLQLYPISKT